MNICRVHHVAIICSNYDVSKDFYTRILGFEEVNEVYRKERDSYKLDLCVGESIKLNYFHSQVRLSARVFQKRLDLGI